MSYRQDYECVKPMWWGAALVTCLGATVAIAVPWGNGTSGQIILALMAAGAAFAGGLGAGLMLALRRLAQDEQENEEAHESH